MSILKLRSEHAYKAGSRFFCESCSTFMGGVDQRHYLPGTGIAVGAHCDKCGRVWTADSRWHKENGLDAMAEAINATQDS